MARRSLALPAFVAEIGRPENAPKIQAGIYTGYATALSFGGLAWYAEAKGVIPPSPGFAALVVAKLVTNTLSWITLRARVLHLSFAALNIAADLLVMTGAVYLTGGPHSPLLPIYFIEVAVMALLTNLGLTIVTIAASFLLFAGMSALVHTGVLPLSPTPYEHLGALTTPYVIVTIAAFGMCILAPGAYVAIIVQRLRDREAALEERARELLEATREKSQFMVNVTHELRTPLHGILGLSDLLREGIYGPVTEQQRESIGDIEQSARTLLELIDGLLLLARAEAAKLDLAVSEVALEEVLSSVVATSRWMLGRKALAIDVEIEPDLPVLSTDRGKLAQILVNLLANAIKFTPEDGHVVLAAKRAGEAVAIAVRDDGIGIPAREIERIFEAFHQVDGSASRTYGGAGLGLSVVRRLVQMLEGEIAVESVEEKGSTFTVTLPITLDQRSAGGGSGSARAGGRRSRAACRGGARRARRSSPCDRGRRGGARARPSSRARRRRARRGGPSLRRCAAARSRPRRWSRPTRRPPPW
jgi:signal transduction histidine kinase